MAEQTSVGRVPTSAPAAEPRVKPLAIGGITFAVCAMVMIGLFHAIMGLTAIIGDKFYVLGRDYVYQFDVTGWGWLHLIAGVIVVVAGFCLFTGRLWARVVGITVAVLSAVANFFFIPYYPVWSVIIIALDVLVIWSLATYGPREAANL